MARTVAEIQKTMLDDIAADAVLSTKLTSTSRRAIYRLFTFIVAAAVAALEQLIDIFTKATEATVNAAAPATGAWLQKEIFKFQYDSTNPQVIQLIDYAPNYPVVDPALRIITRCSVVTDLANNVTIKVAKSDPPEALDTTELDALQSYINEIGAAGITYAVTSTDPDEIEIQAQIYYVGQYSQVIYANVLQAIENYLANLPFNGNMKISDLEAAIKNVTGVTDVLLQNVRARDTGTVYASGTYLVQSNQVISRLWPTVSGYIIPETTGSHTLADTLTFIPE